MNDILDLIRARRSAREPYEPQRPLTKHQLDPILEAACWVPTAHTMQNFEIVVVDDAAKLRTLIAECFANLECKLVDTRLMHKYNLFLLEVLKAWSDPAHKNPKTIHHHGYGRFVVDGEMIKRDSRMR